MAAIPPGSCGLCRTVKNGFKKINYSMRKHVMIYAFFYLLIFEGLSLLLVNKENYATYWYPLLTQIGYFVIFYNLYLFRYRLKFCLRKKIAVASLTIYYALGSTAILFQFCYSSYIALINHLLLLVAFATILLTIYRREK